MSVHATATNTVVTAGDVNYLWGLFLLIASMRKTGMNEPVIVGTKGFTPTATRVLEQLGNVSFYSLDNADHSLTCHKAQVMLQAQTEYVTWADSDAMFHGNCSDRLPPLAPDVIHVRRRSRPEMAGAFPAPYNLDEILKHWQNDVVRMSGRPARQEATSSLREQFLSVSACYLSVARAQETFLTCWDRMMMEILPRGDAGVVDRSLQYYHQLDESCLNACLTFQEGAPQVADTYRLNKDPDAFYIHFVGRPKPWVGWVPSSVRHFDRVLDVVEWAQAEHLELPGPIPYSLVRSHRTMCRLMARPLELRTKIKNRLGI